MHALPTLPRTRWLLLSSGTLLALCVYYLNYGATSFEEGVMHGGSQLTLAVRASAVLAIAAALGPLRRPRSGSALMFVLFYMLSAVGMLLATVAHGGLNDTLFFNTLLQLPILLALVGTRWQVDYARWLGLCCVALALQTIGDAVVWQSGSSLWQSMAFIGGVGNPSSFGLLCIVGLAFCVLHPRASYWRWPLACVLAFGAVMSKSLFAVLGVALVVGVWGVKGWGRALSALTILALLVIAALTLEAGADRNEYTTFIAHKMKSAGELLGLVEYDVESSISVSQRVEMHEKTRAAIAAAPQSLLWGHLEGTPYWPMDSQLLTYLGSFGAIALAVFLLLHGYWTWRAWTMRSQDGGFAVVTLLLFGLIFTTNRVLDYFPVATLYFFIVSTVLRPTLGLSEPSRPNPARPGIGSNR